MKHSFRLKKSHVKTIFLKKLGIKNVSIENKNDVYNTISIILNFIGLENIFNPTNCSYNFLNNLIVFQLELNDSEEKKIFFDAIKKFEAFINIE